MNASASPHRLQGILLGAVGAIAFSGKAIIVKLAYRYGVDAVTVLMYRMLFAFPLFFALSWWASRGQPRLLRSDWLMLFGLGFSGYYLASFLDFSGAAVHRRESRAADPVPQSDHRARRERVHVQRARHARNSGSRSA